MESELCPKCGKVPAFAERVLALNAQWCRDCLKCVQCTKTVHPSQVCDNDGNIFCQNCYKKLFGPKGIGYGMLGETGVHTESADASAHDTKIVRPERRVSVTLPPRTDPPFPAEPGKCRGCGNKVSFAEKIVTLDGDWHKSCLKCWNCHKGLIPSQLNDRKGTPYCKHCYGKLFGPTGMIQGVVNNTLSQGGAEKELEEADTSSLKSVSELRKMFGGK